MQYRTESNPNDKYAQMLDRGWEPDAAMNIDTVTMTSAYTKTTWRILRCPEGLKVFTTSMGKSSRKRITRWVADIHDEHDLTQWRHNISRYAAVETSMPSM